MADEKNNSTNVNSENKLREMAYKLGGLINIGVQNG